MTTWAVRVDDESVGILDLPLSVAAMVCETADCTWDTLDLSGQPGHLAAMLAGAQAWVRETIYGDELVAVAAISLGRALGSLEVDDGAD